MPRKSNKLLKIESIFETDSGDVPYILKRSSRRKTLSICVDQHGDLSVSVPLRVPDKEIRSFLDEREQWILNHRSKAKKHHAEINKRKFESGHSFLFLGKLRELLIERKNIKRSVVILEEKGWIVSVDKDTSEDSLEIEVRKALVKWYRKQAVEIVASRIFHFGRILGEQPEKIAVRTQKRLWGCCDYSKRIIHINWQIILAPMSVVEYVIVHELCHLIVPNHSKRFWSQVENILPDYEREVKWLKDNQADMVLPEVGR
ncbi:MAG: putative metal-dependent hydrolase [Lysobacterales bacterium]|jgi:predicted metal-dependent hydrolase